MEAIFVSIHSSKLNCSTINKVYHKTINNSNVLKLELCSCRGPLQGYLDRQVALSQGFYVHRTH